MIRHARASLAAALALAALCSVPAAAQRRECSPADSARVGWMPPAGVSDEEWPAVLVSTGVVAAETELVRIPDGRGPQLANRNDLLGLMREMARRFSDQIGARRMEATVLLRVEPGGTVTQALVARPSGLLAFDEAARDAALRMRFRPPTVDGCPITLWAPLPVSVQNSATPR